MALAMRVGTRMWLDEEVSEQRDMGVFRCLLGRVPRCAARYPLRVCTDEVRAYLRAIHEAVPGSSAHRQARPIPLAGLENPLDCAGR